jgi:hypothetical protein
MDFYLAIAGSGDRSNIKFLLLRTLLFYRFLFRFKQCGISISVRLYRLGFIALLLLSCGWLSRRLVIKEASIVIFRLIRISISVTLVSLI